MNPSPPQWLERYPPHNVFSQMGEDGVIAEIFSRLPPHQVNWCVDVGASNGIRNSNTRNLLINHGWHGVLIESARKRFSDLERTYSRNVNVFCLRRTVNASPCDSLDSILRATPIPREFAFLSIDVDGNDYHIWSTLCDYRPSVVCIEYNSTFPPGVHYVQPEGCHIHQGTSLASLAGLGISKGYALLCATALNAFFVRAEESSRFDISKQSMADVVASSGSPRYLAELFDGTLILCGDPRMPWHDIDIDTLRFQQIPAVLRGCPPYISGLKRACFSLWRVWRRRFRSATRNARYLAIPPKEAR